MALTLDRADLRPQDLFRQTLACKSPPSKDSQVIDTHHILHFPYLGPVFSLDTRLFSLFKRCNRSFACFSSGRIDSCANTPIPSLASWKSWGERELTEAQFTIGFTESSLPTNSRPVISPRFSSVTTRSTAVFESIPRASRPDSNQDKSASPCFARQEASPDKESLFGLTNNNFSVCSSKRIEKQLHLLFLWASCCFMHLA